MNELLEDFAAKAQIEAEWATPQGLEWFGAFKQKFAELIIRECVDVLIDVLPDIVPEAKDGIHPAWHIKEHFGVEQ